MFFSRDKIKLKCSDKGDNFEYIIDYFKSGDPENLLLMLFRELMKDKKALIVLNTNLIGKKSDISDKDLIDSLTDILDFFQIKYKKFRISKSARMTIGGIKIGNNKKDSAFELPFIVDLDKFERIWDKIRSYNIRFYIGFTEAFEDQLLEKYEMEFEDDEIKYNMFDYDVFNNDLLKQVIIYSRFDNSASIKKIVNGMNKKQ